MKDFFLFYGVDKIAMKTQNKTNNRNNAEMSRRNFIKAASTVAAFTIVPRYVLGGQGNTPPSERVNVGCIGVGGQGISDMRQFLSNPNAQVVAVCDVRRECDYSKFYYQGMLGREPAREIVNKTYAEKYQKPEYDGCAAYIDFNEMLDNKDIDAVLVATPDHIHAIATMAAIKKGKHVYCEKPLTYTVKEARLISEAAREHNVVTQMGNQIHADEGLKILVEMVKSGVIGPVREVHVWAAAVYGGLERPTDTPPVPDGFDWDKWIGPAPYRPYHPDYAPFAWRNWWDFGTGSLGDFGCHIMDHALWSLDLPNKMTIEAHSSKFSDESYALANMVKYRFPARGNLPDVTMTWYDGGLKPFRPAELEEGRNLPSSGGMYIGDEGTIIAAHMAGPRLIPESKMKGFKRPESFLPRGEDHYQEWIRACKGGPKPLSNFDYAGPLTEMVLLGNIAVRTGKLLEWDGDKFEITNCPEANNYLHREYRQGWSL